jgi:hypothetical protein
VSKETIKFPKLGFSNGTFDKWGHKVTFWSQMNAYPLEALNLLSLKQLQTDIQHITIKGGSVETIFSHHH